MLQRKQSITMLLAAILMTASMIFPIWQKTSPEGIISISAYAYKITKDATLIGGGWTLGAAILAFFSVIVAFAAIFSYKNRMLQIKMNLVNVVLILGVLGFNFFWFYQLQNAISPEIKGTFGIGFFLPLLGLLMINVSNHLIRRDEKLVRDADRLR
jgi:hypothetical protein